MINRPFFSLLVLLCATRANALDINGVTLDVRTSQEILKTKLGVDCPGLDGDHFTCEGHTTIESARVDVIVEGHNSVPASITLHFVPFEYQIIGAAAQRKWGKPTSSATLPMQNGFGARHDLYVYVWTESKTGSEATLANASAHGGTDECELKLQTKSDLEAHASKKGSSL